MGSWGAHLIHVHRVAPGDALAGQARLGLHNKSAQSHDRTRFQKTVFDFQKTQLAGMPGPVRVGATDRAQACTC